MLDRSKMTRCPSHPGAVLKGLYMEPLGLTVTALAEHISISRKTLSKILNERARITPDIAQRLAQAFSTDAGIWLRLQSGRDQWEVEHTPGDWQNIKPLRMPEQICAPALGAPLGIRNPAPIPAE